MRWKIKDFWPLPLRLLAGGLFLFHGVSKLTGADAAVRSALGALGLPVPGYFAGALGLVEAAAAVAVIAGVRLVPAALVLVVEMLASLVLATGTGALLQGARAAAGGQPGLPSAEASLLQIAALLALVIGGPGPLALRSRGTTERWLTLLWTRPRAAFAAGPLSPPEEPGEAEAAQARS